MTDDSDLYITPDDKQWINKYVWETPNFATLRGVVFKQEHIDETIALLTAEHAQNTWWQGLDPKIGYPGKLGERAFPRLYPQFTKTAADFTATHYDFEHPAIKVGVELKTTSGNTPFRDGYEIKMPVAQWEYHNYPIVVFGHYEKPRMRFTVLGWQRHDVLEETKTVLKAGDRFLSPTGKTNITCNTDWVYWKSNVLRTMDELLARTEL